MEISKFTRRQAWKYMYMFFFHMSQQGRHMDDSFTLCLELRSGHVMNILHRGGPYFMYKKVHNVNHEASEIN